MEVTEVRPELPTDLGRALKFATCLPDDVIRAVLETRFGDPTAVSAILSRQPKLVRLAHGGPS
jgi:hypothetical protein